ncbi:MAG: hypothetical protein JXR76_27915 [Deltaproteobacteria bacterium]|nr:hypothetical protein [Deltaproteobacteria bacterium]
MRVLRTLISGTALIFFVLANPAWFLSCVGEEGEGEFSFGETEMLSLLEDVNQQQWMADGYMVELSLQQEGLELARQRTPHPTFVSNAIV